MAAILGSTGYDILQGTDEADHIWGLHGGDTIDAGGGDDFVDGGDLSDVLTSSSGYDRLHGGAGDDQIVLTGTGGAVTGGLGFDRLTVDISMLSDQLVFNGVSGHGIIGYGSAEERHIFFHDVEWLSIVSGSGNDRIVGTAGHDRISTGVGIDVVVAGAGNDVITNTGGQDRLEGGDGNDRFVLVGTGSTVFGGAGDDTLTLDLAATLGDIVFNANTGHAIIASRTPDERHVFAQHSEIERIEVITGSGNDRVQGTTSGDVIKTDAGDDVVDGGAGDDSITDGSGANHLSGGDGSDLITTTLYSASVDGGAGRDSVRIEERSRMSDVAIDFVSGTASTRTVFRNIETASLALGAGNDAVITTDFLAIFVDAGAGDDRLVGGARSDAFHGEDVNDRIDSGAGNDTITTGLGDDLASGGDGNDSLANDGGKDILDGGAGDDWIADAIPGSGSLGDGSVMLGGDGNDAFRASFTGEVDGGDGRDLLQLRLGSLSAAIDFDAAQGAIQTGLTFANIEDFTVTTGVANDVLRGGDGNDEFDSLSGNDLLEGHGGNDILRGYSDWDRLFGGDGDDRLEGGPHDDLLSGGNGTDTLIGGTGADTFLWSDEVAGQSGIDHIVDLDFGDVIAFSAAACERTGIHDHAGFVAAATNTADGVYVAFNGSAADGILIENALIATLTADDLVFGFA
ncbi:SMc04171 family calcium-binding repeat protein [Sinorhizobium medicae]|uniref:Hemolysin-type calcium-binding region n=1 Tax=Sinorhizobium medicae (strain WSM419) TaxID=366394 RepID=A6UHI1_SINMW|nr:calcium-binding protein [Sinorhizobium medicae]ABR63111.1 Hemolysin-type calcium-binding region [Sinorhizobium medicae WSM419]